MELSEKKIIDIFNELKERKLIDPNHKIKASKKPGAFRASVFTSNTVFYNPNFSKELNEDMIRFCLLHEEGHLKRPQCGVPALFFLLALGIIPLLYSIYDPSIRIISVFFMLFIIFSSIRILTEPFHWDEYGSDEFASRILQYNYGIKKPSELVKKTIDAIPSSLDLTKFLPRLFFAFIENHPSTEERIRNVIEVVDEK